MAKDKLYYAGLGIVGFGIGFSIASSLIVAGGILIGIGLALIVVSYERT